MASVRPSLQALLLGSVCRPCKNTLERAAGSSRGEGVLSDFIGP